MIETQVLMTVSNFSGFFSRNHSLKGGFTFQVGGCFSVWELHFQVEWGAMVWRGFSKKIIGWGFVAPHAPLLWETLQSTVL